MAAKKNIASRIKLGKQYLHGQGVEQSYEEAYFWFLLSERKSGYILPNFSKEYNDAHSHLGDEQIKTVKKRAEEWESQEKSEKERDKIISKTKYFFKHPYTRILLPPFVIFLTLSIYVTKFKRAALSNGILPYVLLSVFAAIPVGLSTGYFIVKYGLVLFIGIVALFFIGLGYVVFQGLSSIFLLICCSSKISDSKARYFLQTSMILGSFSAAIMATLIIGAITIELMNN